MPVQLDWEIDDVEAPLPGGGADGDASAGGCRRWLRLGLLVALLVAIGLGYLGYKVRQKKKEGEDRLRAVVQLELKALLGNDRELFLNQQDFDSHRWRLYQEKVFEDYYLQSDSQAGFEYTGQVPDVHIEGHEARALVEAARGESVWREMWFYRWTKDEGWRHALPETDWLGDEQEYTTPHLRFVAPGLDGALVANLGDEMEAWYEVLLPLFDLDALDAFSMTVEFSYRDPSRPDNMGTHWYQNRPYTLLAPSPHLGRFLADDVPSLELRQQMAGYLVEALIAQRAGLPPDVTLPVELNALRHELRDWATARLTRALPKPDQWPTRQAPLVEALVAREGVGVVPLLAAALDGPETLEQALATANLTPPDPRTYFCFLLAADMRSLYNSNLNDYNALAFSDADRDWRGQRINYWNSWQDYYDSNSGIIWPSLQVRSVVFSAGIAWVELESSQPEGAIFHQAHFFQRVDARDGERWLLTSPDPLYFGERRETRTENLIFRYFERDAQWYDETVPERLQAVFVQAARDLVIPTDNLTVTLDIDKQYQYGQYADWPLSKVTYPSPRLTGWSEDDIDRIVLQSASMLIRLLVDLKSPDSLMSVPKSVILSEIAWWELGRLFPAHAEAIAGPPVNAHKVMDLSLADLWAAATPAVYSQEWELFGAARRMLIEYLVETCGPGIVPLLLDNLAQSGDVDEWLRASTGQGTDEIEPAWRSWVWAMYGVHTHE